MNFLIAIIGTLGIALTAVAAVSARTSLDYTIYKSATPFVTDATSTPGFVVTHIKTPTTVKGIYMTSWVAGRPDLREKLVDLIDSTEINAVVIDIKDYTGRISFLPEQNEDLKKAGSGQSRIPDVKEFIAELHDKGIYVIGRLSSFQDAYYVGIHPELAVKTKDGKVWQDRKGIKWIDAGAQPMWDYLVSIARESYGVGFDEINFDYIRFPSDGDMTDIAYPFSQQKAKSLVLKDFFAYLDEKLRKGNGTDGQGNNAQKIPISADFFGLVTTNHDDLGIGQVLENGLAHFDFVSPMVYPSHYPPNFNGWENPNAKPYELIHLVMGQGIERAIAASTSPDHLRPWLQDFTLGTRVIYTADKVRDQIKAAEDLGLNSWLLWNAANHYTKDALILDSGNSAQNSPSSVPSSTPLVNNP